MKGYDFFENNCTRCTFGGIYRTRDSGQYEKGKGKQKQGTFKGLVYLACVLFPAVRCVNRKIIRINQIGSLYKLIFFVRYIFLRRFKIYTVLFNNIFKYYFKTVIFDLHFFVFCYKI